DRYAVADHVARVHAPTTVVHGSRDSIVPPAQSRAVADAGAPLARPVRGRAPTTVVHGSRDSIVPPAQSRAVADAAAQLHRLVEVPGADHNDPVLLDGDAVVSAVVELAPAAD